MLVDEELLDIGILLMGWMHLELEDLILNGLKLIRVFGFGFAPPGQIIGSEKSLEMKRAVA
jgi:hypothetical protein